MYFWEASVLGHENKREGESDKTYVAYKFLVQDVSQSWTVERRYNDFFTLQSKLKEKFSESQLPSLPAKNFFFRTNNDPAFIKERAVGLEKYLRTLLKKDSPTCQCGDLLDFLDPNRKSTLNSSMTIEQPSRVSISPLPPIPPRLFVLNPDSIFLSDGEECFLPQFFDHIAESIKYLVQVDVRIAAALSAQTKMNIYEVEKERISSTIHTLQDQQKAANLIWEAISNPNASNPNHNNNNNNNHNNNNNNNNNANYNNANYNNFNDYSNIYNNNYSNSSNNNKITTNNNSNNNRAPPSTFYFTPPFTAPPPPPFHTSNVYPHYPPPAFGAPLPPQQHFYAPPPHNNGYPVFQGPPPSAPMPPTSPKRSEGSRILCNYLEVCLSYIQDAIIWDSGLEGSILVECVNTTGWCEVEERLKWFEQECENLIVASLGVTLPKDEKKQLKANIKALLTQASRYYEELCEAPKHKCSLPANDVSHVDECRSKMKRTITFINENSKRTSSKTAEDIVAKYESKMFKVLEEIANLESRAYTNSEERKEYKDKSGEIRKSIAAIAKRATEFRLELQAEMTKMRNHEGDKTNLPDESSLNSLLNRLEDLQANLADLSHDFGKALEIAKRGGGGGRIGAFVQEKQLEDVRKAHEQNDNDMFEL